MLTRAMDGCHLSGCRTGFDSRSMRRVSRIHPRDHPGRDDRLRACPGIAQCARQRRRDDERRRARQQQSARQRHHARARGRTDRADRGAADCRDAADQIDPQSDQARLRLRRERVYTARMALMEGAYTEDGRREFFKRAVRALRANPQFECGGDERSFSHDLRRRRPIRSRRPKLSDRSRSAARKFRIRLRRLFHDARTEDSGRPRFHHRRHRRETTGRDREREFCAKTLGQSKRARTSGPHFQSRPSRSRGAPSSASCPTR